MANIQLHSNIEKIIPEQTCYLCGNSEYVIRPGCVRDKSDIYVLECVECKLVYLSSMEHIDSNHYTGSGMHGGTKPDINSWLKETKRDDERRHQFLESRIHDKRVLDFGCGVGGFVEIGSSIAKKIVGIEPEVALQDSFKQRGLIIYKDHYFNNEPWDIITLFHVIEHLIDPVKILKELALLLADEGEIIIETPNANDSLLSLYESSSFQNFTYWSQHLYLFNMDTLRHVVDLAGLRIIWEKHIQRFPLSNHLYWLSKGKPGGHDKWHFLTDKNMDNLYQEKLSILKMTDTLIMGIKKK